MAENPKNAERRPVKHVEAFGTLADLSMCAGGASDPVRHGDLFEIDLAAKRDQIKSGEEMDRLSLSTKK